MRFLLLLFTKNVRLLKKTPKCAPLSSELLESLSAAVLEVSKRKKSAKVWTTGLELSSIQALDKLRLFCFDNTLFLTLMFLSSSVHDLGVPMLITLGDGGIL